MINTPEKPLRTAYIAALQTATGLGVFPDGVPKSATTPTAYILITSQTKTRTAIAKPTVATNPADNFGWLASIVFDIQFFSPSGFSNPGAVDNIEEQVINVAETITVSGWDVKTRVQVQSMPLPVNTSTNFINRRVLTYQHWMQKTETSGPPWIPPTPFEPIIIHAGTPIPYFVANLPGYSKFSEVITEIGWNDLTSGLNTGELTRVYDIPVVKIDSNGNGTGTFLGWNIYGYRAVNSLTFAQDTYITLR